jgi:hypothetical protein
MHLIIISVAGFTRLNAREMGFSMMGISLRHVQVVSIAALVTHVFASFAFAQPDQLRKQPTTTQDTLQNTKSIATRKGLPGWQYRYDNPPPSVQSLTQTDNGANSNIAGEPNTSTALGWNISGTTGLPFYIDIGPPPTS